MPNKGTVLKHPVCSDASHPMGKELKMVRVYYRVNEKFIPCGWRCTECGEITRDA